MKFIRDHGIRLGFLKRQKIVVLGYGSQGRAQALNLRDSGCQVVVGLRSGSPSFRLARRDNIIAKPMGEALRGAAPRGDQLICFLIPDECHTEVYARFVSPILRKGMSLVFAHGFNITFNKITPPKNVNVFMVSPKGPGPALREAYLEGEGLPSLVAIHQDATGFARTLAFAFAKAIGCSRRGMFETHFREETISDLFGEQAVLCGGVIELMKKAFETLVRGGVSAEAAYFECFHELKFIVDLLHKKGISGMIEAISPTAQYGGLTRGGRLINKNVTAELKKILKEIKSGEFADEWLKENKNGKKNFRRLAGKNLAHPLETWGRRVREKIGY